MNKKGLTISFLVAPTSMLQVFHFWDQKICQFDNFKDGWNLMGPLSAPTIKVVVGLNKKGLTISFLVAPTSSGGSQLVRSGSHDRGAASIDEYFYSLPTVLAFSNSPVWKRRGMVNPREIGKCWGDSPVAVEKP